MKKCKHNWCLMEHEGKTNPNRVEFRFVCSKCMDIKTGFTRIAKKTGGKEVNEQAN